MDLGQLKFQKLDYMYIEPTVKVYERIMVDAKKQDKCCELIDKMSNEL